MFQSKEPEQRDRGSLLDRRSTHQPSPLEESAVKAPPPPRSPLSLLLCAITGPHCGSTPLALRPAFWELLQNKSIIVPCGRSPQRAWIDLCWVVFLLLSNAIIVVNGSPNTTVWWNCSEYVSSFGTVYGWHQFSPFQSSVLLLKLALLSVCCQFSRRTTL